MQSERVERVRERRTRRVTTTARSYGTVTDRMIVVCVRSIAPASTHVPMAAACGENWRATGVGQCAIETVGRLAATSASTVERGYGLRGAVYGVSQWACGN